MKDILNQGAGGFHMYTVVTDGYGYLIAEDAHGCKMAQVSAKGYEDNDPAPFAELARLALAVMNGDAPALVRCPEIDD